MAVTMIPAFPQATTTTFTLASNAQDQQPTLGGPSQRIARMGDRFTISFKLRPLFNIQAVELVAALIQGLSSKVRAYVPQPQINVTGCGSPTFANAAAATGTVVAMTGFGANYAIQSGQFFNVSTNGVNYLYQTTSTVTASSGGAATVSFAPMLKAPPNSGDSINFATPVIEGFLVGNQQSWDLSLLQSVGLTFAVKESH